MSDNIISKHPIYSSILLAIAKDPSTGEYNPMAADKSYLIGCVPEEERTGDITLDAALKKLEKDKLITRIIEESTFYYHLASRGRPLVNDLINKSK